MYASLAWQSASSPVAAVTDGGAVMVNAGSSIARSGIRTAPFKSIFMSFSVFVMIVNCVASEPVPLVVGIATIGGVGTVITLPRKSLTEQPLVATAPIAFIASIGEPPPTAIRKSHFSSFHTFKPASIILSVGSLMTPSKIAY